MPKIKAQIATLTSPGNVTFVVEELSEKVEPYEIVCESLVSVISPGTELAAFLGAPPLRSNVTYPRLVGYCNVGRVIARGASVKNISLGDRVLTLQSHRSHYKINSSEILIKLSPEISSRDAACGYLFQLGYNVVIRGEVRLGSTVVVIGLGALGLATAAMATLAGARVYGISNYEGAKDRICDVGALDCFSRVEGGRLFSALGNDLAQIVVSTTSDWSDWRIALDAAGEQGTIVVLGFPGRHAKNIPFNPLDSGTFYAKQLRVIAAGHSPLFPELKGHLPFNLRDNIRRIMGWISSGALRPDSLLSGQFEGLALQEAYESLDRRDNNSVTYALTWENE